jgi:hypothetical protein
LYFDNYNFEVQAMLLQLSQWLAVQGPSWPATGETQYFHPSRCVPMLHLTHGLYFIISSGQDPF